MQDITSSEEFPPLSVMCDDVKKKLSIMLHHHRL